MNDFTLPTNVSDIDVAFPTKVSDMMPVYEDIPTEYKHFKGTIWNRLVADWFFHGVHDLKIKWRKEVDPEAAMRHIKYILGSWEPKHEHKEAGVAYLLSLWATDAKWKKAKPKAKPKN